MSAPDSTADRRADRSAGPLAPLLLVPVLLGGVLGAAAGWLWWTWWGPAPEGRIYDTSVGPTWYPDPFDPGITSDFDGTATYVVVGFVTAVVLGVVAALLCRNVAVPGLGAAVLGAIAGGAVMLALGLHLSPPDPATLVADHAVGDVLPGHLAVSGWTPYLAWPVGALLGYLVVMVIVLNPTSATDARTSQTSGTAGSDRPA